MSGAHPENFKEEGGFNFSKTKPNPIVVDLFQPLKKMHATIVKPEMKFCSLIVAFCYNIWFVYSETLYITAILKVVGCEDCVRENKLPLWESGEFLQFLRKKIGFGGVIRDKMSVFNLYLPT